MRRRYRPFTLQLATWAAALSLTVPALLHSTAAHAAGSCPDDPPLRPRSMQSFPPDVDHDEPFDTAAGCPTWRYLAIQRDSSTLCPQPAAADDGTRWRVRPLFAENEPGDTQSDVQPVFDRLPGSLRSFCVYRTDSHDTTARRQLDQNLIRLLERGSLLSAQSSCAAVAPMAGPLQPDPSWPTLADQFYSLAGSIRGFQDQRAAAATDPGLAATASRSVRRPDVRLTLVDTHPPEFGDPPAECAGTPVECATRFPTSSHGLALSKIARNLLCDQEKQVCAAEVTSTLGLPITSFDAERFNPGDIDLDRGGRFGTIDHIAQGVWEALDRWTGQDRLVINLSVAWVGEHYGGLEPEVSRMPASVQALYRVLEVASCRGALVVAAAGNNVGGPEIETGPLLPAAWERRPAPTPAQCEVIESESATYRDLVDQDRPVPERLDEAPAADELSISYQPGQEPLVYAAAGVHADGVPLVNARPDSEPPRAAFGDHAVAFGARDLGLPSIMTGSSLASTIVAAAAAAVWDHEPSLTRGEVMTLVDDSGTALRRHADFFLGDVDGAPTPYVRRISVCEALKHAVGATCEPDEGCPKPECPATERRLVSPSEDSDCPTYDVSSYEVVPDPQSFCDRQIVLQPEPPLDQDPCPFRQFDGICLKPWGCPQPGGNPCATCGPLDPPPDQSALRLPQVPEANLRLAATQETTLRRAASLLAQRSAVPTDTPLSGHSVRIEIDPTWDLALTNTTLGIGQYRFPLPFEFPPTTGDPEDAPRCFEVTGIKSEYVRSRDGVMPTVAVYFNTENGSIEAPVYIDR